ncbi:ArsR family transcriptional regulator [Intrasporangium oryzae NRRL B-24470]|uniref:ArsR family transcriptional regulator n=1 Tax=Intrasporangium oryzae NRRL B-24470 TaxID=1386089 RepID=W9G9P5_9MICO|nr:helix-turn-helix domain-containing protein [Intrasporangium oryzae]EWT00569.1 ArsR family transcriptional regulator [Intrasporangium oryzae NRRL B-24470]
MSTPSTPLPDRARGLGPTRSRVLALVQDMGAPVTAAEIAERLGAHPNTARFHLEALCGSGLVERVREEREVPGRPRVHYVAASAAPAAGTRSYRLLAEILTARLASTEADPSTAGAQAGAVYGRLAARSGASTPGRPTPGGPATRRQAVAAVVATLGSMGFDTRHTTEPDGIRLDVMSCPFLEVASEHLEVVCAVHRGLIDGLLDELDAPLRVSALDPLVAPSHCVARLTRTPSRGGARAEATASESGEASTR